jgi:hypothetical protein
MQKKHSHYFKPCPYEHVDVYRVLEMFAVTDPCLQHAVKKLLVAGGRGAGKDISQDVQEAIDTLERFKAMRDEELNVPVNDSDCAPVPTGIRVDSWGDTVRATFIKTGIWAECSTGRGQHKKKEEALRLLQIKLNGPVPAGPSVQDPISWAERLINQLPETHEGANSWLLNYGRGSRALCIQASYSSVKPKLET